MKMKNKTWIGVIMLALAVSIVGGAEIVQKVNPGIVKSISDFNKVIQVEGEVINPATNETETGMVDKTVYSKTFTQGILETERIGDDAQWSRPDFTDAHAKMDTDVAIIGNRVYSLEDVDGVRYIVKTTVDNESINGRGPECGRWTVPEFNDRELDGNTELYKQSIRNILKIVG